MSMPGTLLVITAQDWLGALYRASWQGAIGITLVWCVCRWWPQLPASARCWLWRLALVKILLVFMWPGTIDLAWLPGREAAMPSASVASGPVSVPSAASADRPVADASPAPSPAARTLRPAVLLGAAWVLGVLVVVLLLVFRVRAARRWRRRCTLVKTAEVLELSESLSNELGVYQPPVLFASHACTSPVVFGAVRTSIVLPAHLLSSSDLNRLRLILRHELAHIRRGDLLWNWVATAVWCLFFFHPLVWLALRELRLSQELACDARAIEPRGLWRADYGSLLIELAGQARQPSNLLVTVGVVESFEFLKRRLKAMAEPHDPSRWTKGVSAALVSVALAGLVPWRLVAQQSLAGADIVSAETSGPSSGLAGPQTSARYDVSIAGSRVIAEGAARSLVMVHDEFVLHNLHSAAGHPHSTSQDGISGTSGSAFAVSESSESSSTSSGYAHASSSEGHSAANWSASAQTSSHRSSEASGTPAHRPLESQWPNCEITLQVDPRFEARSQLIVRLLDGLVAEDDRDNLVSGPRVPPHVEIILPGSWHSRRSGQVAVLLNVPDDTASRLRLLRGELLVVEAKVTGLLFGDGVLEQAATLRKDDISIHLDRVRTVGDGLSLTATVEILSEPAERPPVQPSGLAFAPQLRVEVEDSAGNLHVPRSIAASSDRASLGVWNAHFAALPPGVTVKQVLCTVTRHLGPPERVPFEFKDVPLPRNNGT